MTSAAFPTRFTYKWSARIITTFTECFDMDFVVKAGAACAPVLFAPVHAVGIWHGSFTACTHDTSTDFKIQLSFTSIYQTKTSERLLRKYNRGAALLSVPSQISGLCVVRKPSSRTSFRCRAYPAACTAAAKGLLVPLPSLQAVMIFTRLKLPIISVVDPRGSRSPAVGLFDV